MEKKNLDVQSGTQGACAPILPEKTCWSDEYLAKPAPFSASKRELLLAVFLYVPAYLYLCGARYAFPVFCALFVLAVEWFYRDAPRTWESWFWLSCVAVTAYAVSFGKNRVWGDLTVLFTHAFAVYYVLCRANRLLEGETSHLLPLDALFGLIVFPFRHFFLRIRTVGYGVSHVRSGKKAKPAVLMFAALGFTLAVGLLILAVQDLSRADAAFSDAAAQIFSALRFKVNGAVLWNAVLSLPVGAYLFGLIAGTGRESLEGVRARGQKVNAAISALHKIPMALWTAVLGVFALVYAAFFVLQAGYLFGAFTKAVPEGYTVAEYARQGFFSLCRVMAVNFALLWLVTRWGAKPVREDRGTRVMSVLLLVQSLAFAAVAAAKLHLYIDIYGFTPLRFQSAWLIGVLSCGAVCAAISLLTGKKTFRIWTMLSAAALTLLSLY